MINVGEKLCKLFCPIPNIHTLVLAVLVNEMELPQHLEEREVRPRIINNPFRAVLNQEFQKLEGFVYLSPFLS